MDGLLYFAILCIVILAIYLAHEYWPRSPEAMVQHQYEKWLASCRERGLSVKQQREEFLFRCSWARMSRLASEEVAKDPSAYREAISNIAAEEVRTLAVVDKSVARRFLAVVNSAPLSDILYPDAMAAIDAAWQRRRARPAISEQDRNDVLAALTTRE